MMEYRRQFFISLLLVTILITSCLPATLNANNYEEIPSMLDVLTKIVQNAVEQGYFEKGEQTVLEYVYKKNPNNLDWFAKHKYELRIGVVGNYAVVMVCDKGKPIFEDTYCKSGYPDKDHRGNPNLKSCEITMTVEEVNSICQ